MNSVPERPVGVVRATRVLVSLKWRLLRGGLRGDAATRLQILGSFGVSALLGLSLMAIIVGSGPPGPRAATLLVIAAAASVAAIALLSAATGVESTVDARNLASEPLRPVELGIGLLAAAALGPAGLMAMLVGAGLVVTWWSTASSPIVVLLAVGAWAVTMLLVSRTCANLLGAVATGRFRQLAQAGATLAALVSWLVAQLAFDDLGRWTHQRWDALADVAIWTPPGQLARAMTVTDRPAAAIAHLVLGVSWIPLLLVANVWSTQKLALSSPRPGGEGRQHRSRLAPGAFLRRVTPRGRAGALGRRTLLTRLRSPRQAVNTVTALAIGCGALLVAPLFGSDVDPRLVLVAGVLHFAVLFDSNNAFGYDGPATWIEVSAGADAKDLVRGKLVASLVTMAPAAAMLPVVVALLTGGWVWLPAAWLVAAGSLLGASGVAVANASFAPVAMPDSPNPLAVGDTGQGCMAAVMIVVCVALITAMSLPAAILIFLASERSVGLTTLAALAAPLTGAAVFAGATAAAVAWLRGREAELVERITLGR